MLAWPMILERFSRAIAITSFRLSFLFRGRPTFFFELSYFCDVTERVGKYDKPGLTGFGVDLLKK